METRDFLLELGCEELPPKTLYTLAKALQAHIEWALDEATLSYTKSQCFATPRRLAVLVRDLALKQPPRKYTRQGPSVKAAYAYDGTPSLALMGFVRSCGVTMDQVDIANTPKGQYIQCQIEKPAVPSEELLGDIVKQALDALVIDRPMRWGCHEARFVRPVHWVLLLLGHQLIKATVLGVKSQRYTYGHRFLSPQPIIVDRASDYLNVLESKGQVIADMKRRQLSIAEQISQAAKPYGQALIDGALLKEVSALVEYPVVFLAQFHPDFLNLPKEVLTSTLQSHQKCFPIVKRQNKLQPYFILVSNIQSLSPQKLIKGYERVINARLSDAAFFYRQDIKLSLESRMPALKTVVFQKTLGTLAQKTQRLMALSMAIAPHMGVDKELIRRACELSKCDLFTEMVAEFPHLQGIMGYYYAIEAKEPYEIAQAIKEQYSPRFSQDQIPKSSLGACLALADKLDTLVGIMSISPMPKGDKDPFALRRAALGVMRILIETPLALDLEKLIELSIHGYQKTLTHLVSHTVVYSFCMERLRAFYKEKGVTAGVFASVLARRPTEPYDFDLRIQAIQKFQSLPQAKALALANKRVGNILKKQNRESMPKRLERTLLQSNEEIRLIEQLEKLKKVVQTLYEQKDYSSVFNQLATLKQPVDDFFEKITIMSEDDKLRNNRLAILHSLQRLFTLVADLSWL